MSAAFKMTTHGHEPNSTFPLTGSSFKKDGKVRLFRTTLDGREATTALVVPGQLFGLGPHLGR